MPFFSSSRLAYHCEYKTLAMLCSSGAKKQLAVQAHCGDQSAAMLCSSGSKALSIVSPMLCSNGSSKLCAVAWLQAMLCSNGSSKLSARSDPPRQVSLLSNLVLAALAEYEFGITGSSSIRVQAAQRSVRPAHYKVQSPLSVSVGIRSSIDELCGRMRHARAYDF